MFGKVLVLIEVVGGYCRGGLGVANQRCFGIGFSVVRVGEFEKVSRAAIAGSEDTQQRCTPKTRSFCMR